MDNAGEVYEHWIVSQWAGERLKERGQPVEWVCGLCIWGRGTTGQGLAMDGVWRDIAAEMGILVGQESDWSRPSLEERIADKALSMVANIEKRFPVRNKMPRAMRVTHDTLKEIIDA